MYIVSQYQSSGKSPQYLIVHSGPWFVYRDQELSRAFLIWPSQSPHETVHWLYLIWLWLCPSLESRVGGGDWEMQHHRYHIPEGGERVLSQRRWFTTSGVPLVQLKTGPRPSMEGEKRLKKEAGHLRLVGGGFN